MAPAIKHHISDAKLLQLPETLEDGSIDYVPADLVEIDVTVDGVIDLLMVFQLVPVQVDDRVVGELEIHF